MTETIERSKTWYKVLAYWELRRILYNVLMTLGGLLGMVVLYVNIPSLYFLIGILFNVGYSFLWFIDLYFLHRKKTDRGGKIFWLYSALSLALVTIPPIMVFAMHVR